MIDIALRPTVWLPVSWPSTVADDEGDAVLIVNEIELRVDLKDADEIKALIDPDPTAAPMSKIDAMLAFATDWRGVVSSGTVVPFAREHVTVLLNRHPGFFDRFRDAYSDALLGKLVTREKNSAGSPPNGPAAGKPE